MDELNKRKVESFIQQLDAELGKDLKQYESVINKFLATKADAESEAESAPIDLVRVAAAMASIAAGGAPFYITEPERPASFGDRGRPSNRQDRNSRNRRERGGDRSGDRGRREGRDRNDRRDRGRDDRGRDRNRGDREFSRGRDFEQIDMETYRMDLGESHGIGKGDIVGAIANVGGLESRYMGRIEMFDDHSFIDLPDGMPGDIFQSLKTVKVRGVPMNLSKSGNVGGKRRPPRGGRKDRKRS